MAITIRYTNTLDAPLTEQQVDFNGEFIKVISDNGIIKKMEEFKDGILFHLIYYKTVGEVEATLVSSLGPTVAHTLSIRDRNTHGVYTIENENDYSNGILKFKSRYLVDTNLNKVCVEEYDPIGGNRIRIEKFLYDTNNEFSLGFDYNPDNSIESVHGPDIPHWYSVKGNSVPANDLLIAMPNVFIDHPYYQDGTFLP